MLGPRCTGVSMRPRILCSVCALPSSKIDRVRNGSFGALALRRRVYLASSSPPSSEAEAAASAAAVPQYPPFKPVSCCLRFRGRAADGAADATGAAAAAGGCSSTFGSSIGCCSTLRLVGRR
jgi:hypothetical protein